METARRSTNITQVHKMPSPFPGMDPYLEEPESSSVHAELSSEIARQLSPKLRPKYVVRLARRFVTELPEDVGITTGDIYPDVSLAESDLPEALVSEPEMITTAPLQIATVIPKN